MLPEFEIAIARAKDIEKTRQQLTDRARKDYQLSCEQINHDSRCAELIVYVLQNEPTWSPAYSAARGLQKRLQKEYPADDKLARQLRKMAWIDDNHSDNETERMEEDNDDGTETGTAHTGSHAGTAGTGKGGQQEIPTGIPAAESGSGAEMESGLLAEEISG